MAHARLADPWGCGLLRSGAGDHWQRRVLIHRRHAASQRGRAIVEQGVDGVAMVCGAREHAESPRLSQWKARARCVVAPLLVLLKPLGTVTVAMQA